MFHNHIAQFELLKPLNIRRVFVYRTVKLFLVMGGVSDCKRSGQPHVVCMPQVIDAVRSRISKNHDSGNGYCTENHESHYQTRLGAFKQQIGRLTVALKENRKKKIKMPVIVVQ